MSVWLAIPSAREESQSTLPLWKARCYKVAVFRNPGASPVECADLVLSGDYPGYAVATNALCAEILENDKECDWIVGGGDDVEPDPRLDPHEIARECSAHFRANYWGGKKFAYEAPHPMLEGWTEEACATFGIVQPTGDRFAQGSIDRIAGSPWMGREWCMRANGGQGPFWPAFRHMFGDEALLRVAEKLGVYWRRPDLIHLHRHFMRQSLDINSPAVPAVIPAHLIEANSRAHWDEMQAEFRRLEALDFEPCMPLVEVAA